MELGQLFKTIISAGVMAGVVEFFYDFTMAEWNIAVFSLFGAVIVGCIVYIAIMALIGGMLEEDMQRIPLIGKSGVKIFRKLGIFK